MAKRGVVTYKFITEVLMIWPVLQNSFFEMQKIWPPENRYSIISPGTPNSNLLGGLVPGFPNNGEGAKLPPPNSQIFERRNHIPTVYLLPKGNVLPFRSRFMDDLRGVSGKTLQKTPKPTSITFISYIQSKICPKFSKTAPSDPKIVPSNPNYWWAKSAILPTLGASPALFELSDWDTWKNNQIRAQRLK